MQKQGYSCKSLFTISESSGKKLDQFATATHRTMKNMVSCKNLATYSLQNSLNCLYVRRIYVAFRNILNYRFTPFKINSESSVISEYSEKSQVQSMRNLLLKLKNDPRPHFKKKRQIFTSIDKGQSATAHRKKLLNSIVEKLKNGRMALNSQHNIQINKQLNKKYRSNTPEYNASSDLLSNRKSVTITKLHQPYDESQEQYCKQQRQPLTKFLMKEVLQLKRQLSDAKKTTAILMLKHKQEERLIDNYRRGAQSLSQYKILSTPRYLNGQQASSSARYQRKIQQSIKFQQNQNEKNQLNLSNKSEEKHPQVIINHHVHNYYGSHKIGNCIKPYKNKLIAELTETANLSDRNQHIQQNRQKSKTYYGDDDKIRVTINQNFTNKRISITTKKTQSSCNFSKAIRSRCIGLPIVQINKNGRDQQST